MIYDPLTLRDLLLAIDHLNPDLPVSLDGAPLVQVDVTPTVIVLRSDEETWEDL